MTSRRIGLAWLAAPVAAGTFAAAAGWTVHHEPLRPQSPAAAPSGQTAIQRDARLASRRMARLQASVVHLETSLQRRSARTDRIETVLRAARRGGRVQLPQPGGSAVPGAAAAALPPVPVPTTVHTTTGAS